MPALMPTEFAARIVWLGANPDREEGLPSRPLAQMALGFAGYAGETHAGLTRPSCSRVVSQHPKGTEIRNVRQLTILSAEDLAAIARIMGVDRLDPALTGASLVIEGIPDFTRVPPSSRLQGADGVTLVTRGADLFAASHIHRTLQALLGLPVPRWHHHPLLLDDTGQKLAKRRASPALAERRLAGEDGRMLAQQLRLRAFAAWNLKPTRSLKGL